MQEAVIKRVYRHFKGDYYLLEDIAKDSETEEDMAVYRKLYGDGSLWVRPLKMFLGEVDKLKYPDAGQKYRFQLADIESVVHGAAKTDSESKTVCLINDSFPPLIDGVANAVMNYADIICREYGKSIVVTPDHPQADDSIFQYPVFRYPSIDLTKRIGYTAGLPFSPDVERKIKNARPDIIHSHCPITSTMLARMLRSSLNIPIVFTYHTKFDIDIDNAIKTKFLKDEAKLIISQNISSCNEVWVVSRGAGENLRSLGYDGKYIVMPNGVDLPKGKASESLIKDAVSDYDLPSNVPMFLYVGRMMWYKGIKITLDALAKLKASEKDFRMVFVGGGTDRNEIIEYSHSLGLSDRVFFCPPIKDRNIIRAWYSRADMFLFPSTFDTNGLVVREAAACSLASVLVKGSCAAEDSTDGKDGVLIEENADSMFSALTMLCENPEKMREIGRNASESLYMSWEESVKNACERYDAVIDNYKRGLCPVKADLSEDVFRNMGLAMEAINNSKNRQKLKRHEREERHHNIMNDFVSGKKDKR